VIVKAFRETATTSSEYQDGLEARC